MTKEIITIIENLGLTSSETKIYLSILKQGKTTVADVTQSTGINRRNIYDALSTLVDKGLIFQIIGEKERYYESVAPEKLIELVQSKELALASIMPELNAQYEKEFKKEYAAVYKGIEGFKKYLHDVLQINKTVYCIGAKGGWGSEKLGDYAEWFESERKRKNIKTFNLFDAEMKTRVEKKQPPYNTHIDTHRYLSNNYSTNSAIDIFGDHIVTFSGLYPGRFDENVTLFVIISQELADAWRTWFQFMWNNCTEV